MNKEIKQILKNQVTILCAMRNEDFQNKDFCNERANETMDLLNPTKKPTIPERTKDTLSENKEINSQQPLKPEMDKSYGVEKNEFSSRDTGELRSSGVEDHLPNSHPSPADTNLSESSEAKNE